MVDTDVLVYPYLTGNFTATAEALFERDPDWASAGAIVWRQRPSTAKALQLNITGLLPGGGE